MHDPPGAVRSLCRPSAPSSLDQRLSDLEEKLAQALDFSSADARPCGHCAIAVSEDAPIEAGDRGPQEGLEMPEVSRFGSTSPAPLRIYRQEMLLALFDFSP
jgi:hypothetical protein